ncbi:MAG: photosystem II biogenesis protein Psp29 [Leptolyngbyaceae cyanobacterium]
MSNVRTVSDTKRTFYEKFDRPVVSVYRRVIEELMVEMHLLSVSSDFVYDSIYALGIVTTFDIFMEGYRPEQDVEPIFRALCESIGASPEQYRQDAQQILSTAEGMSIDDVKALLGNVSEADDSGLASVLKGVAARDRFKYSRAFGIGFYTLIDKIDSELVKDKEKLMALMKEAAEALSISFDKLQKDIELYRSNLDKMVQAKALMAEILESDRKKREERAQALAQKAQDKAEAEAAEQEGAEQEATEATEATDGDSNEPVTTPASDSEEQPPQS